MNQKIKAFKFIHLGICAGVILAYFIIGELSVEKLKIQHLDSSDIIYFLLPIAGFFLSNFLFKSQLKQADPKLRPEDNFGIYQTASLIRWAILEGVAFLFLLVKPDLLLLGLIVIAYLISLRPTEQKIITELQNIGD